MNNDTLSAALAGLILGGTLAQAAGDFLLLSPVASRPAGSPAR
jgi:hypothetical protein